MEEGLSCENEGIWGIATLNPLTKLSPHPTSLAKGVKRGKEGIAPSHPSRVR